MLEILEANGLLTLQDPGRFGWQKFGVPVSGPMDWFAFRAAHALAGNDPAAAALEIGFGEAALRAHRDCVIAATGAGFDVSTGVWTFPLWNSFYVRSGWIVQVRKQGEGNWAYLAAAGGFEAEPMLGSRSVNLRAGLGRRLGAGDMLKIGKPSRSLDDLAARTLAKEKRLAYSRTATIEVTQGLQADWFTQQGLDTFFGCEYVVSESSDRMGYRLTGPRVAHSHGADLLSEGMTPGSVQIPPSGQPIVMMADCPTTGGYPKIANVVRADLPVLAQLPPRSGRIRFRLTTVEEAQARCRMVLQDLNAGITGLESDSVYAR